MTIWWSIRWWRFWNNFIIVLIVSIFHFSTSIFALQKLWTMWRSWACTRAGIVSWISTLCTTWDPIRETTLPKAGFWTNLQNVSTGETASRGIIRVDDCCSSLNIGDCCSSRSSAEKKSAAVRRNCLSLSSMVCNVHKVSLHDDSSISLFFS